MPRGVAADMKVEIWSDVVCPWCYIGKRRFERALAGFEHADEVEVTWRSFELDPVAPPVPTRSMAEQLGRKYHRSPEQAAAMLARMDAEGAGEGLPYHLADTTGGNTFDAHRLLHLAGEHGMQGALKEALLHAYFVDAVLPSDHDVLRRVATGVGLPAAEVDDVLSSERYSDEVLADEAEASDLGATGVPYFVIDRRFAIPGAQDAETVLAALRRAWGRSHPALETIPAGDAGSCDGDGCSV